MTMARRTVVDVGSSGIYHCVSRCVRRAFLCGIDRYTGKDYEHRKQWIRRRLEELSKVYAVQVMSYAVMSNHLHVVVRTEPDVGMSWSDREVALRWCQLFPKERDKSGRALPVEAKVIEAFLLDKERVKMCRERLCDLSWFMRSLNEPIARRANREDACTGRFWEGRFKCQRLVDEGAILACMAYVDLNPVRAGIAESPETSEFTSVYDRIVSRQAKAKGAQPVSNPTLKQKKLLTGQQEQATRADWLRGFGESGSESLFVDIDLERYLELVDWTGRSIKAGKQGRIPARLSPILKRLEVDIDNWTENIQRYGSLYYRVAGKAEQLLKEAQARGQRWFGRGSTHGCLYQEEPV